MICPCCGQAVEAAIRPSASPFEGNLEPRAISDVDITVLGRLNLRAEDVTNLAFSGVAVVDPDVTRAGAIVARPADSAQALVGKPLGPRYQIQKLLGAGGMGAVYAAWDRDLAIAVALKTVLPEVSGDPGTARDLEERFKQELLLARQITHKNIVRVYDMGEVEGIKYITMPYLAGADLAGILDAEGRLAPRVVLRIARQVASGLAAAHEAGVVHRDLKPANIMIEGSGNALIMDFGVALSTVGAVPLSPSGPDGQAGAASAQTVAGSVVGTIQYMAPEQACGEKVDHRADIYAFGLILYDLLLGRHRSQHGDSVVAELKRRMTEPLPSPRAIDPEIPEALDAIIARCIQPVATDRYFTTAALIADLDALDDDGKPLPVRRGLTWKSGLAAAALIAAVVTLTWWLAQGPAAPVQHDPVSVMVADFRNETGDAAFDRTLEPMLKLAVEGAGFISAYDRTSIQRTLGVKPPDRLDETAATEIAVKQGLGVVLAGTVAREGYRYVVSMRATQAVTGQQIAQASRKATSKEQVLAAVTELAGPLREALGDDSSDSAQRFKMETLSATSLDVIHEYAAAMEALSRSRFEAARQGFQKAVALDPNFGLAYAGLAIASKNLDKQQDAETYVKQALGHLDGMTEREKLRTRGLFYYLTSDYQSCVREYGDLIKKFASDAAARNNLALCQTYLRQLPQAVEQMQHVVKILPNRALYRENLVLYAAYSGDFRTAEKEAGAMPERGLFGLVGLAFAQLGQGRVKDAGRTYTGMSAVDTQGASYTASGLGDLAIYEGRWTDAVQILTLGASADRKDKDMERAAAKFAAIAHAELLRQQRAAANIAAEEALASSPSVKIRFLAGRTFAAGGALPRARAIAAGLATELQAEPRAYAKIIEGMLAAQEEDPRRAVQLLTEATGLLDTWIGHFELGRAYLDTGAFPQADSEFDRCLQRRGEALALFLDEEPTFAFFPAVYYYQGRVKEELKSARAAESYQAYLDIRGRSNDDRLALDARRRIARK
jgi:eukaryotic-like serine/threonine-protein kinase